ncbi:hypothetical protein NC652_023365, partial [Populus alba x Populus x berolinensis]
TSFYYEWRYKYIDYCKGNSVDAGNTEQWRWKIFEQCQRYWILATAFTEESCLLRARQPSSMLDLAKGNEVRTMVIYSVNHSSDDFRFMNLYSRDIACIFLFAILLHHLCCDV